MDGGGSVLFAGVNWLGDAVMTAPAVREFRRRRPAGRFTMLVKPHLAPFWRMIRDIDDIMELRSWPAGVVRAAAGVRRERFEHAYCLTQSFRSAIVPFLAGIPRRTGMPGHFRDWLLTEVVKPGSSPGRRHQAFEYYDLLGMGDVSAPAMPQLQIPGDLLARCGENIQSLFPGRRDGPLVGIFPGAAHGPSKRWPASRFGEVAKRLESVHGCRVVFFGAAGERQACSEAVAAANSGTIADLCGRTSLPELAAMLSLCGAVLANDSGGMHLAAMAGAPVVAIFGITDPEKTGPIGPRHRVIAAERARRGRDLKPDSREAVEALLRVRSDDVFRAVMDAMA